MEEFKQEKAWNGLIQNPFWYYNGRLWEYSIWKGRKIKRVAAVRPIDEKTELE